MLARFSPHPFQGFEPAAFLSSGKFHHNGAFGLVNGLYFTKGLSYPDRLGNDLEAIIDLKKRKPFLCCIVYPGTKGQLDSFAAIC